ncbi:hypothetical protein H257_11989 [Aphanomyces astaci]|uniref:Uncharacterized protein n=1 Tax=Aphanomyces astaci TaxID=112090 RepID=W4G2L6_APHAT|nr:hypothetical protein H257_11989 [Aphanomyces astaci]ETV73173.1 hypothetical protein H257_11989 [Aphanomyces astaci]|eukprot:XP_009837378.1 hypothetical protein H257_11989 [Aphanomyces astaci]
MPTEHHEWTGSFDACGLCFDATDPRRQNYNCVVEDELDVASVRVQYLVQGLSKTHFSDPTYSTAGGSVCS